MFKELEIVTKRERQNSHLEQQRKKFKFAGNSILLDNNFSSYEFTKGLKNENDRTDHSSFLEQMGYQVDSFNQELHIKNRKCSISINQKKDQRLSSRQSNSNSIATRNQTMEINNYNSNVKTQRTNIYNHSIIRKTFCYDNSDQEIYSDYSQKFLSENTPEAFNTLRSSEQKISTKSITTLIKSKFKRIRKCFQIIKALSRMKNLCKQKKATWDLLQEILKKNQKSLKYNESITVIKIKQWTQMVFSKAFSIILQKKLEKCKLNFIDKPEIMSQIEKDQAILTITNTFTFAMQNLVIMSSNSNLLNELQVQMYQEQFLDYRKTFSQFVSQRVRYVTKDHLQLTEQEKQLILSECIIINNLIPSLVKLTESLEILRCDKPNIEFLIRCLISLIQYFFMKIFSNFPKIEFQKQKIKFSQYQLGRKESSMVLINNDQIKSEDLIYGTYKEQQLKEILTKNNWLEGNAKKMKIVVANLITSF
ncbi:unnamed protein product [Paramecium sonneborni]|uniref:Uncharacterized protein n=1 Tax=Paramecium sonneborni TaxID=65129 RepID=A0A8S1PAU8_9CILI|nr:unnamed protein product [Paramecium sonneborni]